MGVGSLHSNFHVTESKQLGVKRNSMSISTSAISVSLFHRHARITRPCPFLSCRAPPPTYSASSSQFLCSAAASGSNSGEIEESRWLREEQRWLREEQRWFRQESRWISERESLLTEISILRLRIQQLESESERRDSLTDSLSQIASLQTTISLPSPQSDHLVLPPPPPTPSSSSSLPPEAAEPQKPTTKEVNEDIDLSKQAKATNPTNPQRKSLRIGSEGDEVREMQEALLKLGFYSGEEDMEFSSFSSDTQRAVKTWQASLGAPEDGIMTEELLKRLYGSEQTDISASLAIANGAAITSVTESAKKQQTVFEKEGIAEREVYQHRVFLLGENRWEEPSRIGNDKQAGMENSRDSSSKCLACHGEGRIMCTECDGSGEPNIEPQFLEWVDEELKCPYCEGLGHTICDTCLGKSTS